MADDLRPGDAVVVRPRGALKCPPFKAVYLSDVPHRADAIIVRPVGQVMPIAISRSFVDQGVRQ